MAFYGYAAATHSSCPIWSPAESFDRSAPGNCGRRELKCSFGSVATGPPNRWTLVASLITADAAGSQHRPRNSDRPQVRGRGLALLATLEVEAELLALIQRAEMWTNTSFEPSSGWINPNPFWELNHFTVPCDILFHHATRRPALHGPKYFSNLGAPDATLPQ